MTKDPFDETVDKVVAEARAILAYAPQWSVVPSSNCWMFAAVETHTGVEFHVRFDHPKKYTASAIWPRDGEGQCYSPDDGGVEGQGSYSINVSKSRGPRVLVYEIERRLLPQLRVQYPRMLERVKGANENKAQHDQAMRDIAEQLGTKVSDNFRDTVFGPSGSRVREVRVNHNGTSADVKLDYGIPMPLLWELISLLKKEPWCF